MPAYVSTALYPDAAQLQHEKPDLFGSGRVIGANLILTARHVVTVKGAVEPTRHGWKARREGTRPRDDNLGDWVWDEAEVVWDGGGNVDVALLAVRPKLGAEAWCPKLTLRIASVNRVMEHRVRALGYPLGANVDGRRVLMAPSGGLIDEHRPTLTFKVDPGYVPDVPAADWPGFSGASVFLAESEDLTVIWIYGVAQRVPAHFSGQLDVARLEMALRDSGFQEQLKLAGVEPLPATDPVEAAAVERILRPIQELVKQYPFPKVSQTDCYEMLGVNMWEQVDRCRDSGKRPPYICREQDDKIIAALKGPRRFVLVAGPSAAGKTRTAYEMLLRHLPDASLLVPAHPDRLSALIDAYKILPDKPSEVVLWLDDLDRFLQTGDPLQAISTARAQRLLIVATIRSKLITDLRKDNEGLGREVNQLLDRAEVVTISDRMTSQERERAGRLYPDVNFEEGIGESLIAGKRLREKYDTGPSELVAVVCAANDWRRAGMGGAIPAPDLNELFKSYFKRLESRRDATSEKFASGIEAACDPIVSYSVLLMKETHDSGEPRFSVPDYVSDYVASKKEPIPEETWRLAIRSLRTRADGASVGDAAWFVREDIAEQAWRYGADLGDGRCARRLSRLMRERGDAKATEDWLRQSLDLGDGIGTHDLGVLLISRGDVHGAKQAWRAGADYGNGDAADALANVLHEEGDLEGSEAACRRGTELGMPNAALNLGSLLRERGDETGAENAWREGVNLGSPGAAFNLGQLLRLRGDLEGAKEAWRAGVRLYTAESPIKARPLSPPDDSDPEAILNEILRRHAEPLGQAGKAFRALLLHLAAELVRVGDLEGAEQAWQTGADRGYSGEHAYYLGELYSAQGDSDRAAEAWRRGMELGSPKAAYSLGSLRLDQKDPVEAIAAWERALSLNAGSGFDADKVKRIREYMAANPDGGPSLAVSADRYTIAENTVLPESVTGLLQGALQDYASYLENLRFVMPFNKVTVCAEENVNRRPGWRSYFDPDSRKIVIDNSVVSDEDALRREYTHFILIEHRPKPLAYDTPKREN